MRHILGLSGKDSLCTALLLKAFEPKLYSKIEIFTTLTGADYPETVSWLSRLSGLLDKEVIKLNGNIFAAIENAKSEDQEHYFLPSIHKRYCTNEAKFKPFKSWINSEPATLYVGVRYDENRVGFKSNKILTEFPLHKYRFDLSKVWSLIQGLEPKYRPPVFYWERLHLACKKAWAVEFPLFSSFDSHISEIQKVILLSGRSRPNCFFCFNQRRYEVCWLYDYDYQLFQVMQSYEKKSYSWIKDFPLNKITPETVQGYANKRAKSVIKQVAANSFGAENDGFINMPSCGLFCGK